MAEYKLSRAKITNVGTEDKTNRYFVRVIPYMDDIDAQALPTYPAFFSNKFETYNIDDTIWCLHTDDFQVGYVLGLASKSTGNDISLLLEKIHEVEVKFGMKLSEIQNLKFEIYDGVYLDFMDKANDIVGRITEMGTSIIYGGDGSIYINASTSSIALDNEGSIETKAINENFIIDEKHSIEAKVINEKSTDREIIVTGNSRERISGDNFKATLGSKNEEVTGDSNEILLSKKNSTISKGETKNILAGGENIRILVGDYSVLVGAGSISLTSALGVNITAGASGIKLTSAGPIAVTASKIDLNTPVLNLNALSITAPIGVAGPPSYTGPFCALPACLFTGAPHVSNKIVGVPAGV